MIWVKNQMKRYTHEVQKGLNRGASVPIELGSTTPTARGCVHQPKALWTPYLWDFYGSFIMLVPVCVHAKSLQSCQTLCNPIDCSPWISVFGILQARILEWVAMPSCRGSSWPREHTCITSFSPALSGGDFTTSDTWKTPFHGRWYIKDCWLFKIIENW